VKITMLFVEDFYYNNKVCENGGMKLYRLGCEILH
jgi:hypothetical protein